MLKKFVQKVEDVRRLIENSRSASLTVSPVAPRFLLAVSGGMDSMCLLDLFSKTFCADDFAVAHCNFSLRGEESDGDQALVEARSAELGTRLFVKRFDTGAYAVDKGISIEMAARELRYSWFKQLCIEHGFDVVVVAHNANDNAETLILNLLRGTGLNGLHGMAEVASIDDTSCTSLCLSEHNGVPLFLFRPLLEFTRKQIEGYALVNHLPYRHDSSNFSSDYKRNKIRNEVFPVFERINPSFVRTLNREISYFAEAGSIVDDWCCSQVSNVLNSVSSEWNGEPCPCVDTDALLTQPHWKYLLYYLLQPYGFNSQTLASIESLLTSDRTMSGKRFESQTHILLTAQKAMFIVPKQQDKCIETEDEVMVVRGPGVYNFNGRRFAVEIVEWAEDMPLKQPAGVLIMDADRMKFPFVCRRWRQGDWFVPYGMRGKKKVSDLFTDLKYNALEKASSVILVDTRTEGFAEQQHVAGLLGLRADDSYKVTLSTKAVVRISL